MTYEELQRLADEASLLCGALEDFARVCPDAASSSAWPFGDKSPLEVVASMESFVKAIEVEEALAEDREETQAANAA